MKGNKSSRAKALENYRSMPYSNSFSVLSYRFRLLRLFNCSHLYDLNFLVKSKLDSKLNIDSRRDTRQVTHACLCLTNFIGWHEFTAETTRLQSEEKNLQVITASINVSCCHMVSCARDKLLVLQLRLNIAIKILVNLS